MSYSTVRTNDEFVDAQFSTGNDFHDDHQVGDTMDNAPSDGWYMGCSGTEPDALGADPDKVIRERHCVIIKDCVIVACERVPTRFMVADPRALYEEVGFMFEWRESILDTWLPELCAKFGVSEGDSPDGYRIEQSDF
jgi:hypothetical protein